MHREQREFAGTELKAAGQFDQGVRPDPRGRSRGHKRIRRRKGNAFAALCIRDVCLCSVSVGISEYCA